MVSSSRPRYSYAEYLELEERSPAVKFEFLDGQVWAMAGGSPEHSLFAANVIAMLREGLRDRPCAVFTSDMRVRVSATGLATYPDVAVVCGKLALDPDDPKGHTVTNPVVIIEVLSPSTEDYDRGEKVTHYKRIDSLREILLIAHDEPRIEHWRQDRGHWTLAVVHAPGVVDLASVAVTLPVDSVYLNPLAG